MKSVVSTIAVLFAVTTLVACSKKEEAPAPVSTPPAVAPAPVAPAEPTSAAPTAESVKQEEKK